MIGAVVDTCTWNSPESFLHTRLYTGRADHALRPGRSDDEAPVVPLRPLRFTLFRRATSLVIRRLAQALPKRTACDGLARQRGSTSAIRQASSVRSLLGEFLSEPTKVVIELQSLGPGFGVRSGDRQNVHGPSPTLPDLQSPAAFRT